MGELWEDWMRQVDQLLTDAQLLNTVYEALARRWPNSRTRGRKGTPAEVVLRLLLLKHMRNWSYAIRPLASSCEPKRQALARTRL